jgi:hypothetical protein
MAERVSRPLYENQYGGLTVAIVIGAIHAVIWAVLIWLDFTSGKTEVPILFGIAVSACSIYELWLRKVVHDVDIDGSAIIVKRSVSGSRSIEISADQILRVIDRSRSKRVPSTIAISSDQIRERKIRFLPKRSTALPNPSIEKLRVLTTSEEKS